MLLNHKSIIYDLTQNMLLYFFTYYRLDKLMEEINTKCQSGKTAPSQPKDWQPKVGEVCVAKFHEDER